MSGTFAAATAHDKARTKQSTEHEPEKQEIADVHSVISSGGEPLDSSVRALMQERFGRDFTDVRVHRDSRAAESARGVVAKAYTFGNHIVFKSGEYVPDTPTGQRSIAHELAHVVQQTRGGGPSPAFDSGHMLEHAAHEAADRFDGGGPVDVAGRSAIGLARDEDEAELQRLRKRAEEIDAELSVEKSWVPEEQEKLVREQGIVADRLRKAEHGSSRIPVPGAASADQIAAAEKQESAKKPAVRLDYPADPEAMKGIQLAYAAPKLPVDGINTPGVVKLGDYWLAPHLRADTGQVVYYVAYSHEMKRNEFIVGPDMVENFKKNEFTYRVIAAGAYPIVPGAEPSDYQAASGRAVARMMEGNLSEGFSELGSAWKMALTNPEWYMQTVLSAAPAGGKVPKASVPKVPPVKAPVPKVAPIEPPVVKAPPAQAPAPKPVPTQVPPAPKPPAVEAPAPKATVVEAPAPKAPEVKTGPAQPKVVPKEGPSAQQLTPPAKTAPAAKPTPAVKLPPAAKTTPVPKKAPAKKAPKKPTIPQSAVGGRIRKKPRPLPEVHQKIGPGGRQAPPPQKAIPDPSPARRKQIIKRKGTKEREPGGKTVSTTEKDVAPGVKKYTHTVSGQKHVGRAELDRVQDYSKKIGHDLPPQGLKDNVPTGGKPGDYYAGHAEKQHLPNKPVTVDKPMCSDCMQFKQRSAAYEKKTQVVHDPEMTREFHPDGSITYHPKEGGSYTLPPGHETH